MRWLAPLTVLLVGCSASPRTQADHLRAPFAGADTLRSEVLAEGVRHLYAWDGAGPWAIHVAEVAPTACVALEARHAGPPLSAAAPVRVIAPDALAAINADFFALPEGTPVGVQVQGGEVLVAPGRWQAAALSPRPGGAGGAELVGEARGPAGAAPLAAVNRPAQEPAVGGADLRLFTRWFGERSPAAGGSVAVRVERLGEADGEAYGRVVAVESAGAALALDAAHVVFTARRGVASPLERVGVGDTLRWRARIRLEGALADDVVGGFPVLLRAGSVPPELATEPRPSFGEQRHPRTAVGWTPDGRFLLVTVDGRQPPYSDGMTLHELAGLMARLGTTEALNLDGGGSTTMVVRGRIVNRPSDASGERAVGNVVAVLARPCG